MDHNEDKTPVVFRVWRGKFAGDVLALFPAQCDSVDKPYCMAFEHVGQHGAADYDHVIRSSRPATASEYARLKVELEAEPYNYKLKVYSRATPKHRQERYNQWRGHCNG